jgi:adenosylmethionine-8-amino-7-oxononanoate aminotransferase
MNGGARNSAAADRDAPHRPLLRLSLQDTGESDAAYAARAAQALEDKILELGPDEVIAFVAETVVGATLGAVPPVADYFKRVREICDRYGVLLILDEVMCGMGRTGTLHACEQDGVAPDLMAIAKGLGGGYQPIGAVLLSTAIFEAIAEGSGFFQHGHTYMGHPMAAPRARGAGGDPPRRSARQCRAMGDRSASAGSRRGSAITITSATSRPRAVPRRRTGRRSRDQGAVRAQA